MSIPALIVPILNRPDLLRLMLRSIDHEVDRVVIVDNGEVVDPFIGAHEVLPFPVSVIRVPSNLGVSGAWNLGMKVTPTEPWWLICNSDLTFGAGDLARLEAAVDEDSDTHCFMFGMAAFALTRHTLDRVGWFDENFHPAYDEDLDWDRRAKLVECERVETGFTGTHVGSATVMADPELRYRNGITHAANDAYYARKWGGHKQGGETFLTPFNRGGHIGDWRLEPDRLREQAWPRPRQTE